MENIINLKDFRHNVQKYAEKTRKGESFLVFKRSKPLFKITSVEEKGSWEEVADFTKIKKGGVNIAEILKRL